MAKPSGSKQMDESSAGMTPSADQQHLEARPNSRPEGHPLLQTNDPAQKENGTNSVRENSQAHKNCSPSQQRPGPENGKVVQPFSGSTKCAAGTESPLTEEKLKSSEAREKPPTGYQPEEKGGPVGEPAEQNRCLDAESAMPGHSKEKTAEGELGCVTHIDEER